MRGPIILSASWNGDAVGILVDEPDARRIGSRRLSIGSHGYAQICVRTGITELLHRWLLDLRIGDGLIGDHLNGSKFDNRRCNLRIVHASGSSQNVAGRGKSRFRGVHPQRSGRWSARVKFRGRTYYLGTYDTEEEAAEVADAKRRELMPFYVPPSERAA